ncbi:uncharacterized protein A1O9_01768 [Exophiala aquamarina CBS 119918]|uniref:Zn(2)-C6 fungal-type domain-containing protein n=1 Tax=Exophiala aquamarina CBS 119918 TaxID=1182545 RepID=A0A072Q7B2_9EURO|nr:uncharacterized protein A1O9_01768 [Exophiala aquamarina CBS 119918]KEF63790.1 hypothetical protein A1O9_01768 [Exophiala aquamarina CBS 119918]
MDFDNPSSIPVKETSRPYRSHKFPACDLCRKRKSRCVRSLNNRKCVLCQMHGADCTQDGISNETQYGQPRRTVHQGRSSALREALYHGLPTANSGSNAEDEQDATPGPDGSLTTRSVEAQSGHIVGPVIAHDVQVLDQYMSPSASSPLSTRKSQPYSVYSKDPSNPILYLRVPRRRELLATGNGTSGFAQCEAISKVLEPHCNSVFDLYFSELHPPFPFLDESEIRQAHKRSELPYPLLCEIYAASMIFWERSTDDSMRSRPQPDIKYIWRQTVKAMDEEFTAPGFATILACILDLAGRPTTLVTYNALNIGRLAALSHSLGLNRSPRKWTLHDRKKALRIRTWWAVLIHDWWASLTAGTPPHITLSNFDVELPDLHLLGVPTDDDKDISSNNNHAGACSFVFLCRLTEILGSVLPLIYSLKPTSASDFQKVLRRIAILLDEWEDSIPQWLNYEHAQFKPHAPGALNLRLCFLATKMCISRLLLLKASHPERATDPERKLYLQSRCRKSAEAVIEFTTALQEDDLRVFWLPSSHFASATTLLLGCALEAPSDEIAHGCVLKAQGMVQYLRMVKNDTGWDLADVCLAQCETITHRMSDGTYLDFRRQRAARFQNSSISQPSASNTGSSLTQMTPNTDEPITDVPGGTELPIQSGDAAEELLDVRGSQFDFGAQEVGGLYGLNTLLDNQWGEFGYISEPHMWEYSGLGEHPKF